MMGGKFMKQADLIRHHIIEAYFDPARQQGHRTTTIRSGDIHKDLRLFNSMPAVCSVLAGRKLLELSAATITVRRGPANGASVFVTYDISPSRRVANNLEKSASLSDLD